MAALAALGLVLGCSEEPDPTPDLGRPDAAANMLHPTAAQRHFSGAAGVS